VGESLPKQRRMLKKKLRLVAKARAKIAAWESMLGVKVDLEISKHGRCKLSIFKGVTPLIQGLQLERLQQMRREELIALHKEFVARYSSVQDDQS